MLSAGCEQAAERRNIPQQLVFPKEHWQLLSAEEVCSQPELLDTFVKEVGGSGVIVKNGYLIKSWGDPAAKVMWASATKPLFSTLLLFALHEGKINGIDDTIFRFMPELKGKDRDITFFHLANMLSGYARRDKPGQAYAYNDYAVKLYQMVLFGRVFSQSDPNAVLQARLGELQFEDGQVFEQVADYGFFVHTSPRDFARIGWFWLNKGKWNSRQLLPASLFDQYQKVHVAASMPVSTQVGRDYLNIGTYGGGASQSLYGPGVYGMNWWFNHDQQLWPSLPPDTFQANGHWNGETLTMLPGLGIVIAGIGDFGAFKPGPGRADTLLGYVVAACGAR